VKTSDLAASMQGRQTCLAIFVRDLGSGDIQREIRDKARTCKQCRQGQSATLHCFISGASFDAPEQRNIVQFDD